MAVHSAFGLNAARQTTRILRALERPCVTILAHPTGRLLGEREPLALDMARILRAAREQGVLVSIASDAHGGGDFADLAGGIRQARRGWLRREDVLNTRRLAALRPRLARTQR